MEICRVFRLASVFGQKCARLRPNRFVAFVNFNQKWICTDKSIRIESNQNKTIYWIDEKRRGGKRREWKGILEIWLKQMTERAKE